ncbi:MAG: PfkB family kinase, nonfunctional [Microgenomates group bacterium GW2011_GWA2_46_7]|nr:MAG: PfkB family kinase, nonfunctional [Microgenomates group bacterium GW2011_GWA2_46_7]
MVTIGSATLDIFMKSDKFKVISSGNVPGGIAMCEVYGGKMEVEEVVMISGGGATNCAVSLAKKDLKTAVVAEMGNDPQALLIHQDLEAVQVDTRFLVQEPGETTAVSVVLIADDGGRSIMVHRGASAMLTKHDLPWEELETRWMHVSSLGGNIELLKDIVKWAKQKGVRLSINPGLKEIGHKEKLLAILSEVEILFINRDEARELWGIDYSDELLWKSTQALPGARVSVITDGARGGKVSENGKVYFYQGEKVKKVVDTTGAGDGFASGMIAGVLYGKNYEQAIGWGVKNATAVLKHVGAKKGLLTLVEINR